MADIWICLFHLAGVGYTLKDLDMAIISSRQQVLAVCFYFYGIVVEADNATKIENETNVTNATNVTNVNLVGESVRTENYHNMVETLSAVIFLGILFSYSRRYILDLAKDLYRFFCCGIDAPDSTSGDELSTI